MSPKLPPFFTIYLPTDEEVKCYFDYQREELQRWNGLTGKGDPGCPASLTLTEVDFGKGRESLATYPQLNIPAIEELLMEKVWEFLEGIELDALERDQGRED